MELPCERNGGCPQWGLYRKGQVNGQLASQHARVAEAGLKQFQREHSAGWLFRAGHFRFVQFASLPDRDLATRLNHQPTWRMPKQNSRWAVGSLPSRAGIFPMRLQSEDKLALATEPDPYRAVLFSSRNATELPNCTSSNDAPAARELCFLSTWRGNGSHRSALGRRPSVTTLKVRFLPPRLVLKALPQSVRKRPQVQIQ